jgi:cardiolipin synthase
MLWVAAVLTLLTGWDYLTAGLRHATRTSPVPRSATAAAPGAPGQEG